MDRLSQLYNSLGINKQNGLFKLSESSNWIHKFPYRVGRILNEVIKPDAFFCLFNDGKLSIKHPQPFNQGFIFFFDNPSYEEETLIHSRIINFGLAQAVFINRKNTLDLYHGNEFNLKALIKLKSSSDTNEFEDFSFTNQISGNTLKTLGQKKNSIDNYLLSNITDARRILIAPDGLKLLPQAANRLIGRLLFISYLIDRNVTFGGQDIITGENKLDRKTQFRSIISKKNSLYKFFKYLTIKYDGDMFPLKEYEGKFLTYDEEAIVQNEHLTVLSYLFNSSEFFQTGKKYNGYLVQKSLFDLYDFEIIPVELISSIYENFIGNESENEKLKLSKQKSIKAYYTPPYLVDYVLSQTVAPFLAKKVKKDSNCKVLDPSCGSGIFLVETLRKIIEKELSLSEKNKISDAKLWKLIKGNIFGIDIDSDAIDITIFSMYITILDYKHPAEIETFKFQKLKDENLFAGKEADFFNTSHIFNKKIKELDFIIGNPPWGTVKDSDYINYIKNRDVIENENKNKSEILNLEIGDKEICQAFLVRTSDFISAKKMCCCLIISSKVLYNTYSSSKNFRNYFLQKFSVSQLVELSPVNNKIRGGNHIFENARQPAAIITFTPEKDNVVSKESIVQHITVKPNKFFVFHKSIVIEKHDVKNIKQEYFMERWGGYDWLWKVLVHGNLLDIHFIKRLFKNKINIKKYLNDNNYDFNGGLKVTDGNNKNPTIDIINYDYLDAEIGFKPYNIQCSEKWKKIIEREGIENGEIGYLPDLSFFKGEKLLVKKGIVLDPSEDEHFFQGVSAYNEDKICFTSTVCSIIPIENNETSKIFLSALSGLLNSKLFTYFLLNTSSSAGIERSRIHFDEFLKFPIFWNPKLSELVLKITSKFDVNSNPIVETKVKKQIETEIIKLYGISDSELSLIDFALNISIPILLRESESEIFKPLKINNPIAKTYLNEYTDIVKEFFKSRFSKISKSLNSKIRITDNFIRIDFIISEIESLDTEFSFVKNDDLNDLLGDLGIYKVSKDLYFQQDVRGFTDISFYVIKPNEKKVWHSAVAYLDALEFEEELINAELNNFKEKHQNARG